MLYITLSECHFKKKCCQFHLILHESARTRAQLAFFLPRWLRKSIPVEWKKSLSSQVCHRAFQSKGNVLGENHNLIIPSPGEGQEVIIKWSFACRNSQGNADHKPWDAKPSGLHWLKVTGMWIESDIVFRWTYTHTHAHTHSFIDGWANMHS